MSTLYFIQAGKGGPIKIGRTDGPVEARVADIQTSCPAPLTVLRVSVGDGVAEKKVHRMFAGLRVRGEWYKAAPSLLTAIKEVDSFRDAVEKHQPLPAVKPATGATATSALSRPLAALRGARQVTATDLAQRVGVTERAVYAWERGESALSAVRVRAIAEALSLTDADELGLLRWAALAAPGDRGTP